ncbi:hypothetical protein JTE90_026382 [Oedothorax gibbosus]|uniref:Tc1-like transposase DDE domain-containing protein n=1 Tax=Oedothorax gibbosus TaxID=931172 RepID=A0AAV6VDH9_9ARAC|nr:hypothetical protein JTE90_026382 [Oedothorax gibbosus]
MVYFSDTRVLMVQLFAGCHRVLEEAETAMSGMTSLFHSLFPIVPVGGHSHFFFRTDHASVHRTVPVREVIRDPGGGRFRVRIDFSKRGPDCLGKCITQGRLHPLRCHSLC